MYKLLMGVVVFAAVSFGTTYTFNPSPSDLSDLPHASAISWGIGFGLAQGEEITSAKLQINDLWNWKANESNALWINLLDNPSIGVVNNVDGDATLANYYASQGVQLDRMHYNWDGTGKDPNNGLYSTRTGTAVSIVQDGMTWNSTDGKNVPKYDVTLQFTGAELTALASYINNNKNFGFGIDADCHFYNSGVSFTMDTKTTKVPEPGLLSMLGVSLLGVGMAMRRKKAK